MSTFYAIYKNGKNERNSNWDMIKSLPCAMFFCKKENNSATYNFIDCHGDILTHLICNDIAIISFYWTGGYLSVKFIYEEELRELHLGNDLGDLTSFILKVQDSGFEYFLSSKKLDDEIATLNKNLEYAKKQEVEFNNKFNAFKNSLKSIDTIGSTISISHYADCEKLETVTVVSNITAIGNYAFRNCRNLSSVYCPAITPPDLGYGAFEGCDIHMVIYVPECSVNKYKQKWSSVADKIIGYKYN